MPYLAQSRNSPFQARSWWYARSRPSSRDCYMGYNLEQPSCTLVLLARCSHLPPIRMPSFPTVHSTPSRTEPSQKQHQGNSSAPDKGMSQAQVLPLYSVTPSSFLKEGKGSSFLSLSTPFPHRNYPRSALLSPNTICLSSGYQHLLLKFWCKKQSSSMEKQKLECLRED